MIGEFTFVTLSYNQDKYIEEHLNSIKYLIKRYGKGIDIHYLLIDDHSKDTTVDTADKWLKDNPDLFCETEIYVKEENKGTVDSFVTALKKIKTSHAKILGGDDKYFHNNVFEIYSHIKNRVLVTPPVVFGATGSSTAKDCRMRYKLFRLFRSNKWIKWIMKFENTICAPAAFYDISLVKNQDFYEFIQQFKFVEDYPMWRYLLDKENCEFVHFDKPFIYYRVGSGVSTGSQKPSAYIEDRKVQQKKLDPLAIREPKAINPYRYIFKLMELFANMTIRYPVDQD